MKKVDKNKKLKMKVNLIKAKENEEKRLTSSLARLKL